MAAKGPRERSHLQPNPPWSQTIQEPMPNRPIGVLREAPYNQSKEPRASPSARVIRLGIALQSGRRTLHYASAPFVADEEARASHTSFYPAVWRKMMSKHRITDPIPTWLSRTADWPARCSSASSRRQRSRPRSPSCPSAQAAVPFPIESLDGGGNNIANPTWGQANRPYLRVAPAVYADGIGAPQTGPERPLLSATASSATATRTSSPSGASPSGAGPGVRSLTIPSAFAPRRDRPPPPSTSRSTRPTPWRPSATLSGSFR